MSQDTPTVDPLRFALSPWAFTGDEIALVRKRLEEAMRAALSATQPAQAAQGEPVQGVPEGWKLVPVEPTQEMLASVSWPGCAKTDWHHMLTASPTPPAQQGEKS